MDVNHYKKIQQLVYHITSRQFVILINFSFCAHLSLPDLSSACLSLYAILDN